MNPFLNPITGIPFLKRFLFDPNRIKRMNPQQLEKYRNKVFRKIVKYAYTVPIYHQKYKATGIHPEDIRGIKDITKLPFITKKDLVDNYPDGIIPPNYDKSKAVVVSTSGSTGKPVSVFFDFSVYSGGIGAAIRTFLVHNVSWRKSKFANIGNFSPGKADEAVSRLFFTNAKFAYSSEKYGTFSAFEPIKEVMKKLDAFSPDIMLSYPVTYQNLAFLKNKGFGKNVNPKFLLVSGYVLDDYTRSYVEDAFKCKMFNGYGAAETSSEAGVAFECPQKTWHINHDYYHVETIDENMELLEPGKIGHIVVTRFFGKGTPLIRYTGLDDWVKLTDYYECGCRLCTPTFKDGVEGRRNTSIILPDGRVFPSASFAILSVVLNEMKTRKVKQFQIIQNKLDEIDILIVIDEDLRNKDPPIDTLFKKIKEIYQEKVGPGITISVKEVKNIKSDPNKPAPLVISRLSQKDWEIIIEKSK
ncbi:MAG: phenylacetate--CoA ligase family protein [Thermoplasmatales archaeon]|nr:phenylacetate--CoA ligase family protein [Thermoplasmatales archaeon]